MEGRQSEAGVKVSRIRYRNYSDRRTSVLEWFGTIVAFYHRFCYHTVSVVYS